MIRLVMRHAREPGLIAESKNSKPDCCPLCGGTPRVIADFTDPVAIQIILAHLKQRTPPNVRMVFDYLKMTKNTLNS